MSLPDRQESPEGGLPYRQREFFFRGLLLSRVRAILEAKEEAVCMKESIFRGKQWCLAAALCLLTAVPCLAAGGTETDSGPLPLGLAAVLPHGSAAGNTEPAGLLTPNRQTLSSAVNDAGYFKGIRLAGRVRVVENFPDIRVKVVSSFPDLRVKAVDHFPDAIGEWQFVDSFPDFTISYVTSFEDIRIQFVDSFPGLP
jgi:hypothetical protein